MSVQSLAQETLRILEAVASLTPLAVRTALSPDHTRLQTDDVVLITGGSSGLGLELARQLAGSCRVASVDIQKPVAEVPGVLHYVGDVTDPETVERVRLQVMRDLGHHVTVLINNAGIMRPESVVESSLDHVRKTLKVNLYGCFVTTKAFLPDMMQHNRGYIVTMGSVLGHVSPALLSSYGASKAGLLALHESLTYEITHGFPPTVARPNIKTLLVCPGQIQTPLFAQVHTPSVFAPVLPPRRVAARVALALRLGLSGTIYMPAYARFAPLLRFLPEQATEALRFLSGMDRAMYESQC